MPTICDSDFFCFTVCTDGRYCTGGLRAGAKWFGLEEEEVLEDMELPDELLRVRVCEF